MHAPIVTLECIGDLSAVSVLPSPYEEQNDPVLHSMLEAYKESSDNGDDGEQGCGTIRRTAPPARSNVTSPIRFDGSRDLFSPSSSPNLHPRTPCRSRPQHKHHARHQSFIRPRIATETFRTPMQISPPKSLPSSPVRWSSPVQEARLRRKSREVFEVFFEDALRISRSPSMYSQSSVEEAGDVFTTPPTSQKPGKPGRIADSRSTSLDAACSSEHTTFPPSNDPTSTAGRRDMSTPPRKVSFATRSSPKSVNDEEQSTNANCPVQQPSQRNSSFNPGLHEQERRCEQRFGASTRRPGQGVSIADRGMSGIVCLKLKGDNIRLWGEIDLLKEEVRELNDMVLRLGRR
jgi:hypothetical protein